MPVVGSKRRNSSEAACDSSHCAFCFQRSLGGRSSAEHDSGPAQSHDSSGSRPVNDFQTWLTAQTTSAVAHDQTNLDKIGLPSSQLHRPPSKRTRISKDFGEASSSDSSDPNQISLQAGLPDLPLDMNESQAEATVNTPWQWSDAWAEQLQPVQAAFTEIGSFQEPASRAHAAQHTSDIVCGCEFSPDGRFLASVGVAKQVRAMPCCACIVSVHVCATCAPSGCIFVGRILRAHHLLHIRHSLHAYTRQAVATV